jgi:hypothetical protein
VTYDRHLTTLAGKVFFIAKALSHDVVYAESSPKEDAHLAVLTLCAMSERNKG